MDVSGDIRSCDIEEMEELQPEIFCYICRHVNDWSASCSVGSPLMKLKAAGTLKLITTSKDRMDDDFHDIISNIPVISVHKACYKFYTHPFYANVAKKRKLSEKNGEEVSAKNIRIEEDSNNDAEINNDRETNNDEFDWKNNCFICAKPVHKKKKLRKSWCEVQTRAVTESIVEALSHPDCEYDEPRKQAALERLENVFHLQTLGAVYHRKCYKDICSAFDRSQKAIVDLTANIDRACELIVQYIETHENAQFTLRELLDKLPDDLYKPSEKTILNRLKTHYGDENLIVIAKRKGSTLICLSNRGLYEALNESRERQNPGEDPATRRLEEAAEDIVKELSAQPVISDWYPESATMLDNLYEKLPGKLKIFLNALIKNTPEKRAANENYEQIIASLGHVLMSAMFPRKYLSPLLLSLAVSLHREFGTKNMIEMLHSCGLTASYKEAVKYERSAAKNMKISLEPGAFIQFVWDNCDSNIKTILGGEFHVAGEIGIITPSSKVVPQGQIPRPKVEISAKEIEMLNNIKVLPYTLKPSDGLENIMIQPGNLDVNLKFTEATKITAFWILQKYLNPEMPRGWNGFIEELTAEKDYEVSSIRFFPFINAKPNDYNTLFTTIVESVAQAETYGMKTCIITFDQQLYWKARDIVAAKLISDKTHIFIRLGGFHTLLSFLGCIGVVMRNSGLHEALCSIYGDTIVKKILVGKQYSRAVRSHTLALVAIVKQIFNVANVNDDFKSSLEDLRSEFYEMPGSMDDLVKTDEFKNSVNAIEQIFEQIENKNSTCKLWITYCRMVFLIKDFIFAEKSGNWDLHVSTLERMIPFFHSTGHFNYAKSVQIYVQDCKDLPKYMSPDEYQVFTRQGYWTCRRVQKFFSGIFTDQTIEQTLMKKSKLRGGLFDRGVTPSVAYQWLMGTAATNDCLTALENFTQVTSDKNFQHKDSRDSMLMHDKRDLQKLEEFFTQFCPFPDVDNVTNIANGISGDNSQVTCYEAFEKGLETMREIVGSNFKELKLSLSKKVTCIGSEKCTVKVGKSKLSNVDPLILFHRILALNRQDCMEFYLTYELAAYPPAMFDKNGMRKNEKSKLYKLFEERTITVRSEDTQYVIDGGMLLHKFRWQKGQNMFEICNGYVRYIKRAFRNRVFVVFDGYDEITTKSTERNRRCMHNNSATVRMAPDTWKSMRLPASVTQDKFLGNSKNKSQLIKFLQEEFERANIMCQQSVADADVDIVLKAIDTASGSPNNKVVIVSEDTDVLTMLVGRTPPNLEVFLMKPPCGRVADVVYSSESLASKPACIRSHILFLHAFTGCDTTSAFFYRGKLKFFELFQKYDDLHGFAEIFKQTPVVMDNLIDHGLRLALALYGAPKDLRTRDQPAIELVQIYRAKSYTEAANLQKVDLARLIPTANALTEHIKRVYFQVQAWSRSQGQEETLDPLEWGWELVDGELSPVTMTQEAGPEDILSKISCSCQTDCGPRCGCRRSGLECSLACKNCDGNCSNQKEAFDEVDSIDEEQDEGEEENSEGQEREERQEDVEELLYQDV